MVGAAGAEFWISSGLESMIGFERCWVESGDGWMSEE